MARNYTQKLLRNETSGGAAQDWPKAETAGEVSCDGCGTTYAVSRHYRHGRYEQKLCAKCRGRVGGSRSAQTFTTPESTKAERVRANGLVNMRLRKGWFTKPDACMNCGKIGKVDMEHPDYSKPGEVLFVCRSCHVRAHHNRSIFDHLTPIDTAAGHENREWWVKTEGGACLRRSRQLADAGKGER